MKALNSILICGLIALFAIKPLVGSHNSSTTLYRDDLVECLAEGLETIAQKFDKKIKILATNLLKDNELQQANTPSMKEFRNNITDYLYKFKSYERYGLNNILISQFDNMIREFKDKQIFNLLNKYSYKAIREDYEKQYEQFIKQKFLPKFEEHKEALINWSQKIKNCSDYNCQSKFIDMLVFDNTSPRDDLLLFYRENLDNIYILVGKSENDIAHNLLKSIKLSQLSPKLKENLIQDLQDFIKYYEKHESLTELFVLIKDFDSNILEKYYYNSTLPLIDQQNIKQIFDEQGGLAKFLTECEKKFKDFIHGGLFRKFQKFKAALNENEYAEEEDLIDWYEQLKGLTNIKDIKDELDYYY